MITPKDAHRHGLRHDLPRLLRRREALVAIGSFGAFAGSALIATARTVATAADGTACVSDAIETPGPFPADGTNVKAGQTVNVLTESGVVREDLRPSFAGMTPTAEGLELTLELRLLNTNAGCAPLAGYALYLWQCDAAARYSLYEDTDRNYLRGVGISDASGVVRFTTVFPGCYGSRWPHLHFEVFADLDDAASGHDSVLISQLALPEAECTAVYSSDERYPDSARSLARLSLTRDRIFRNDTQQQTDQRTLQLIGSVKDRIAGSAVIGLAV
jgi:protocatechuate 3,4-dioxygenase beta subunit